MTKLFFWEQLSHSGWSPCFGHFPSTKRDANGTIRLHTPGQYGARLRAEPVPVNDGHSKLTLAQLNALYGVDGQFSAQRRQAEQ